jgi:uncharacterized phiE125 gp8 family phage protein
MSALHLVTPPSGYPVSLEEAKAHLRIPVDMTDEDDLIESQLAAASDRVELETGRQLLTATRELWLDSTPGVGMPQGDAPSTGWGPWNSSIGTNAWMDWGLWWTRRYIDMPFAPLLSVVSIKYTDTSGVVQTWDPTQYQVSAPAGPLARRGRVQPAYGMSWPTLRDQMDALIVQFTCGYGPTGDAVPQMLRRAILLILGDLYENREATVVTDRRVTVQPLPYGVDQILQQYRARPVLRAVA